MTNPGMCGARHRSMLEVLRDPITWFILVLINNAITALLYLAYVITWNIALWFIFATGVMIVIAVWRDRVAAKA